MRQPLDTLQSSPMGRHDSSRTRVAPVFNWLQCWDPSGEAWLLPLLELAIGHRAIALPEKSSPLREARWWPREAKLPAHIDLLRWLIENCEEPDLQEAWGKAKTTQEYRRALVGKEPEKVAHALRELRKGRLGKAPHVLEGPTQPDALLGTDELLVVIEGKRDEAVPTTATWWMRTRHQMLRHLDGAWDQCRGRRLFGLMIIDQHRAKEKAWQKYPDTLRSEAVLEASLPHRLPEDRSALASAFLGIITWQEVCARFNIPTAALLDETWDAGVYPPGSIHRAGPARSSARGTTSDDVAEEP